MIMNDKINTLRFIRKAHSGQTRKYTGEPYWIHPLEVSIILEENVPTCPKYVKIAALLHDVVEDTKYTNDDIKYLFGEQVAELVYWVTDKSRKEDGNRETIKAIDREHLSRAPIFAKNIKLADIINNTLDIVQYDENFARIYMREIKLLLEVLKDADEILYNIAKKQVETYFLLERKEK